LAGGQAALAFLPHFLLGWSRVLSEGDLDSREHFAVSPLGVALTALGAVLVIVACFRPAAEVPVVFNEVKANSLIQGMPMEMIVLLLLALAAAGDFDGSGDTRQIPSANGRSLGAN
jgi:hypothetical protein